MDNRPLYLLPLRVVLVVLALVVVLGALGGALAAWLMLQRLLRVTPAGERVIERVEQVTVSAEDALAAAAEALAPSVIPLVDERGRGVGHALAITADGVLVSAGPVPSSRLFARVPSGDNIPASVVRIYRDAGVFFLRVEGTFKSPTIEPVVSRPGSALLAVASSPDGLGPRVQRATVEAVRVSGTPAHGRYPGLERLLALEGVIPPSFDGVPVVGTDGKVQGLVLIEGSAVVIPGGVVDLLLQDYLRHPAGTEVGLLRGLQGRWETVKGTSDQRLYRIAAVSGGRFGAAGLRRGDGVTALAGKPLQGPLPLLEPLLTGARAGERVRADVQRGAETLTMELAPEL